MGNPAPFSSDISDLFFNLDHSNNREYKDGLYHGWDDEKLNKEAEWFLASLRRLGVGCLPSNADLITDFKKRV